MRSALAQAHAVVLDLAAEVCATQAMARKGHEGGLEGPQSRRVVLSMTGKLRKEGTPSKSEGLLSIIVSASPITKMLCCQARS